MIERAFLFDIDGTLLTSGGAGSRAHERVFARLFGVERAVASVKKSGRTDYAIAQEAARKALGRDLTKAELATLNAEYCGELQRILTDCETFRVFKGVNEVIQKCADDKRVLLGIQTGNIEPAARLKLDRAGILPHIRCGGYCVGAEDRIEVVRCAMERVAALAPHLSADQVVVIGDTPGDIRAAKAVGAVSVAIATGEYSANELSAAEADHVLSDLTEFERHVWR